MEFISKCLKELDSQKLSSIAFPGLTTGFHKFPKNVASKNACRAIAQYIDDNPNTSLKEVRFVALMRRFSFDDWCTIISNTCLSPE